VSLLLGASSLQLLRSLLLGPSSLRLLVSLLLGRSDLQLPKSLQLGLLLPHFHHLLLVLIIESLKCPTNKNNDKIYQIKK
jgi:hypothetical protein